jgi:hypothetical protein
MTLLRKVKVDMKEDFLEIFGPEHMPDESHAVVLGPLIIATACKDADMAKLLGEEGQRKVLLEKAGQVR